MSLNQLHNDLKQKNIKVLFTDYYDTIIHRTVHPNYTQRIWAKLMIRELGLPISIDELYFIRQSSVKYLIKKLKKEDVEIPYNALQEEIYKRLINSDVITIDRKEDYISLFEDCDVRAESDVQYINEDVLNTIKNFKSNGGNVYLVSDFYGSKTLFEKLLKHHNILELFDGIYSSAELEASKHKGSIYAPILKELELDAKDIMMIGDNLRSDVTNATKNGLNAYHLPHAKYLKKNKRNNFGNDKKRLKKIINNVYKTSKKESSIPFTEYIIHYHTFTERLYEAAKRKQIKDLFFLSREGQYLKKLFDSYQDFALVDKSKRINTHYLKISRQASLQIALKDLKEEQFPYLRKKYSNLSIDDFLIAFNCPNELRSQIISELNTDAETVIEGFFDSSCFENLKANQTFITYYNSHRVSNHNAFKTYINSFNSDIENEGVALVDIGWGGTMQESIYKFFEYKIPVTGFYLGLNEIYDIQPKTKRYGLNFSLMPYTSYDDYILKANSQLYEQFSAADHGSALGYSLDAKDYTLEYHKPEEKWLYENYIVTHQAKMFQLHKRLLKELEPLCYSQNNLQTNISKIALKVGLFQSTKKLKFLDELSHGFYQNIGTNKVGITYEVPKIKSPMKMFISFLMTPEKFFRYLVKLKPMLYKKSKLIAFFAPMGIIYLYFGFNKFLRYNVFHRFFLLKFNSFRQKAKPM